MQFLHKQNWTADFLIWKRRLLLAVALAGILEHSSDSSCSSTPCAPLRGRRTFQKENGSLGQYIRLDPMAQLAVSFSETQCESIVVLRVSALVGPPPRAKGLYRRERNYIDDTV